MSTVRTILKNILSLSAAQVLTKLLTLVATAYTARILGVEQFGRWSFAAIFASYFSLLASLGVDSISSRHVARDPSRINDLVSQVVTLRFIGSALGLLAVGLVTWMLPKPVEIKWLILLCYVPLALGFWNLMWVFVGQERLELVAVSQLLEQLVNAGVILLLVRSSADVLFVPVAGTLGVVAGAACLLAIYVRRHGGGRGTFNGSQALALVRETLPFGLSQVLGQMYFNFDSVLLSFLRTDAEVGWYNAAYKLVLVIIGFRFTIIYSLNPTFARLFAQSPDELRRLARRVLQLTALAGLPIGVGGMLLSDAIIRMVFGAEYAPAATALQVLVWSSVASLINLVGAVLLSAAGRWKTMLKLTAIIVAVNVAANLVLIPRLGIVGAAWATVLADAVSLVLYRRSTRDILAVPFWSVLAKPFVCVLIMGLVLWPLRATSIALTIPLGALVYGGCLFAMRLVSLQDVRATFALRRGP